MCVCVCVCSVTQSCLTLCDPMDYNLPGSFLHGIFQARILEHVTFPSPRDLSNPEIELVSPALQADSLSLSHLGSRRYPSAIANCIL